MSETTTPAAGADTSAADLINLFMALESHFHSGGCACSGCGGASVVEDETLFDDPGVVMRQFSSAAVASTSSGDIAFSLSIANAANVSDALIEQVEGTFAAAFATLSMFIDGLGSIDLRVEIESFDDEDGLTLASAFLPGSGFVTETNSQGSVVETPGTIAELNTGIDPNGAGFDGFITIGAEFLEEAFVDLSPTDDGVVPAGQIDFFSVILHELFHIIGFFGFRNPDTFQLSPGETPSIFDSFIEFDADGLPVFTGPNAVAVYGAPIPLESTRGAGSNIYHLSDEPASADEVGREDLSNALTSAAASFGDREIIGSLELAILADLGLNVTIPEERQIIDFLDRGIFPNLDVEGEIEGGGRIIAFEEDGVLDLTIVRDGLANGLPSVGFEVIGGTAASGADFQSQTDRFVFVPQTLEGPVTIDLVDDNVFDSGETFTLRLFNPANSFLEDGGTFQDFEIVVLDTDTPTNLGDDDDVLRFFDFDLGVHRFTTDDALRDQLLDEPGRFFFEGASFESLDADAAGARQLLTFVNPFNGSIFFTLDAAEAEAFADANPGFSPAQSELIFGAATQVAGTEAVFRFLNTETGAFFYTQDAAEIADIEANLPELENQGIVFFAPAAEDLIQGAAQTAPAEDADWLI